MDRQSGNGATLGDVQAMVENIAVLLNKIAVADRSALWQCFVQEALRQLQEAGLSGPAVMQSIG